MTVCFDASAPGPLLTSKEMPCASAACCVAPILLIMPLLPAAARADTFALNAVLLQGTLTGTISINTQLGTVFDSNLLFKLGAYQASVTGNAGVSHPVSPFLSLTAITDYDATGDYLSLILPVASLLGYGGGGVCATNGTFCEYTSNPYAGIVSSVRVSPAGTVTSIPFLSGSLTPVAVVTPEPGTLGLLGTGMLGVAGVLRRRPRGEFGR